MTTLERLTTKVLPEAVKVGAFGTDMNKFVSFIASGQKAVDQFSSNIIFGDVMLENSTGERFVQPLVIKTQSSRVLEWSLLLDYNAMFHNEVLFYTKIVPLLRKYDKDDVLLTSIGEFVYGKATNGENPEEDVIILKDMKEKGFKMTEDRLHIDEKHIKLALDRIAKFHGLSLACQKDDAKRFNEIVIQIKELVTPNVRGGAFYKESFNQSLLRGIKPLERHPKYQPKLPALLAYIQNAITDDDWVIQKYWRPSEPLVLAVIAHGDMQRNNMMFKYGTNGDPVEVVFFDFALIKLGSPALDTSVPTLMNVSPEVRNSYWDDFLRTYYGALSHQLDGHPMKPSFETVELDMRQTGVYGYIVASHVVPTMTVLREGAEMPTLSSNPGDSDKTQEENGILSLKQTMQEKGGHKATELLVEIIKHMLDKEFIFHIK